MIGNRHKTWLAIKNRPAFSLVEVLVSVALFSTVILTATEIFKMTMDNQRSAIATQNVQESMKYFLEVMNKEIRMAQKDRGTCPDVSDNQIFSLSSNALGDILYFKNYNDQCVAYFLELDDTVPRFRVRRGVEEDYISPEKIRISRLDFVLNDTNQPVVTINIQAYARNLARYESLMSIQTSITSRYYRN